jgi:hypothetical protein
MTWEVHQNYPSQGRVTYTGTMNGVPIQVTDPKSWDNQPIWPGQYHNPAPDANDPTRVRVEDAGTDVEFGPNNGITVTPMGGYSYGY